MLFNESLNEELPFRKVNLIKCGVGRPPAVKLTKLHPQGVVIKVAKYKNLQELKPLIPPVHHTFYETLPHQQIPDTKKQNVLPLKSK